MCDELSTLALLKSFNSIKVQCWLNDPRTVLNVPFEKAGPLALRTFRYPCPEVQLEFC